MATLTSTLSAASSPFLLRNQQAHLARWGIALAAETSDRVIVEPRPARAVGATGAAAGWPDGQVLSARICDPSGAWVKMHSDRAPLDEAAAWWAQLPAAVTEAPTLALAGGGLGYLLDVIEAASTAHVLLLEPEPGLVPWLLARRDWSSLIQTGRLLILEGPDYADAGRAWGILSRAPRATPPVIVHPVTSRTHPDAAAAAARALTAVLQASRANALARRRFEGAYLLNTLTNVGAMPDAPSVRALDGRAHGQPVVIAGAGPSLNRNIAQLREVRDRVTLVATDTALAPLLAAGLPPDLVVAVDPGPLNARHLTCEGTGPRGILVAEASIDPASFAPFVDRTVLYRVADHAPWRWLTRMGVDPGQLRAWGSVVTSAFDLALHLGGSPVIFIGADLAYTDGQPYCRGTRYEDDWAAAAARTGTGLPAVWEAAIGNGALQVTDLHGHDTRTAAHLVAYRDWLVQACADAAAQSPAVRFINATGAGILYGPGITPASLADAVQDAPRRATKITMPVSRRPATPADTDLHPADAHLVRHLLRREAPALPSLPPPSVTPYMARTRSQRLRDARRLRTTRGTDKARWADVGNLDVAWERRAAVAGQLVPPGSCVLDLGAGREALERHLPADATYVPADVVRRSPRTRVVDLNAGTLPAGRFDVVTMLGVLEYLHAPTGLLRTLARRTDLLVLSYCVVTRGTPDARLLRGWMNDFTLSAMLDVLRSTGWDVAWASRLDRLDDFDQWLFACRPAGQA